MLRRRALVGAAVAVVAATAGCANADRAPDAAESLTLVVVDTLITTASELIGGVSDLAVAPDGDVYVADYRYKHVLVVGPDGAVRRTIGAEGAGPGEFQLPWVVGASADSVRVLDATGNRVQVFDRAGELARSYRLDVPGFGGGRSFRPDGRLAATIGGIDSAMVVVLDADGAPVARFGEPLAPAVPFFDFHALKAEIRDGRVPDAFRNQAVVTWAPDHSLYLVFLAEAEVRRYDSAGGLVWHRTLDEPELRAARTAFIRRNTEEQNPAALHPLEYVTDAAVVNGDLWLLLNTADRRDGLLLVLRAADGALSRRATFPRLPIRGQFAVDEPRRRLYLALRGEAAVLIFELPAS